MKYNCNIANYNICHLILQKDEATSQQIQNSKDDTTEEISSVASESLTAKTSQSTMNRSSSGNGKIFLFLI